MLNQDNIHRINHDDTIIWVNENWVLFALKNEAPALSEKNVLGKSLWNFIVNEETRYLYKIILDRVRSDRVGCKVPFRCDSPTCRRFMELEIIPLREDAVEFRSHILKLEFRKPVDFLDVSSPDRSGEFVKMCGWCKKVFVSEANWLEVEEAIARLNLFTTIKLPQVTHGICPSCNETVLQSLS